MERDLATVEVIKSLKNADNSDNLSIATIKNWECIVARGQFSEGEKVIFFEVDAFLPLIEQFEFLRKSSYRKFEGADSITHEGFRIKTIRLRGNYSQGLVSKYDDLLEEDLPVGTNVAERLGVIKYEPQGKTLGTDAKGLFPSFIPKTSATLFQNLRTDSKTLDAMKVIITEKLDGTSVTFFKHDGEFGVCSRNLELKDSPNLYWNMARKYNIEEVLPDNTALQGEIFGVGIQGNPLNVQKQFAAFSMWKIETQAYVDFMNTMVPFCDKHNIPVVPILKDDAYGKDIKMWVDNVESLKSKLGDNSRLSEGVVFLYANGEKVKIKSMKYNLRQSNKD